MKIKLLMCKGKLMIVVKFDLRVILALIAIIVNNLPL